MQYYLLNIEYLLTHYFRKFADIVKFVK